MSCHILNWTQFARNQQSQVQQYQNQLSQMQSSTAQEQQKIHCLQTKYQSIIDHLQLDHKQHLQQQQQLYLQHQKDVETKCIKQLNDKYKQFTNYLEQCQNFHFQYEQNLAAALATQTNNCLQYKKEYEKLLNNGPNVKINEIELALDDYKKQLKNYQNQLQSQTKQYEQLKLEYSKNEKKNSDLIEKNRKYEDDMSQILFSMNSSMIFCCLFCTCISIFILIVIFVLLLISGNNRHHSNNINGIRKYKSAHIMSGMDFCTMAKYVQFKNVLKRKYPLVRLIFLIYH